MTGFILLCLQAIFLAYFLGQTWTAWSLLRLLRRREETISPSLRLTCTINLLLMPLIMFWVMAGIVWIVTIWEGPDPSDLVRKVFSKCGIFTSILGYGIAGIFLYVMLRQSMSLLYKGSLSFMPMIVMAMICLIYCASMACVFGSRAIHHRLMLHPVNILAGPVALYIPAAPLVGLVLLIVHVARVRAARTWETYIPPQEEEIP